MPSFATVASRLLQQASKRAHVLALTCQLAWLLQVAQLRHDAPDDQMRLQLLFPARVTARGTLGLVDANALQRWDDAVTAATSEGDGCHLEHTDVLQSIAWPYRLHVVKTTQLFRMTY